MIKRIKQTPRGFTLVEVIIVFAIIGILAAVTAPSISNMVDRNRSASFARGVANQFRFARNQAASTNQALLVRVYKSAHPRGKGRGTVQVFAHQSRPTTCREMPPTVAGYNRISRFDGWTVGGRAAIEKQSVGGGPIGVICVQPNGAFLTPGSGTALQRYGPASAVMCTGEAAVIPLSTRPRGNVTNPHQFYKCNPTINEMEQRDEWDYWRIALWDNGQVTARRK